MIRRIALLCPLLFFLIGTRAWASFIEHTPAPKNTIGTYTLIIEGFDWGPAVNKVVLSLEKDVSKADKEQYQVSASRRAKQAGVNLPAASGSRTVLHAYVSDATGKVAKTNKFITLVLAVAPNDPLSSPIQYLRQGGRGANQWIDYSLSIQSTSTDQLWNQEGNRIMPLIDKFDLSGKYTYKKGKTLTYASYEPGSEGGKKPLIIWLHGGGEGGTDPSIPLIANRAANYASPEIQRHFGGAYVLVPQSPTFWMQNAEGSYTRGQVNDVYNQGLMSLIKDYVKKNPKIDKERIYLGGCSNGGYMSLKLILLYPEYFAAGYISALAYNSEFISDEQIKRIKDVPIWFMHSKDDQVTKPDETAVPVYKRLKAANAPNVHFSYFDHVIDITGLFGGEGYHYSGHWSWIYSHANKASLDFDGKPVLMDGRAVSVMEWMAAQSK
ncbi:MAG: prolyl oligopeptidase family serine peptidase [Saprospiraceae bacterium]|nr:prolyl oligopeptidase family serine peptidase [Saprospiraceae bacterium]